MRPNRVQSIICQQVLAKTLGEPEARRLLQMADIDQLPTLLPAGPRDLSTLAHELQPFVTLYRALQTALDLDQAIVLGLIRQCIIESGLVSHTSDATAAASAQAQPLNLTSPPPEGFVMAEEDVQRGFELAMSYFSCEGQLIKYSPQRVQFHITGCNWCKAMQNAGAPELIPFICETDERFMDGHPTHRLRRPTAIGLGDSHCDFQFVPIADIDS